MPTTKDNDAHEGDLNGADSTANPSGDGKANTANPSGDGKANDGDPGGGRKLARFARMISAATMLSRVLGLVREQLFAALLGASVFADAFNVAFRIPNLLRDLFAEGALSQAFVPTFKSEMVDGGRERAYRLANLTAGTLLAFLGTLVVAAEFLAPLIVEGLAGDFQLEGGKFEATVTLTRIMLPFLPIISLAAVAMGVLNAQDRYGAPALAPATFNVISIAVGTGLYVTGVEGRWVVIGWSIGTVLGGMAQLGIQLPSLRKIGVKLRPRVDLRLRDRGLRRIGKLMTPAIFGLAAVQINIVVNTVLATSESGAVSWLNYAFRFLQLPIGVFGVAIATVSTTRYADAAAIGDRPAIADRLTEGLRLVMFLTVPATVGLVLLAQPIIQLMFERGAFDAGDTAATALALQYFVIGLVAYSGVKVIAPAFYAVDKALVPMIASGTAVAGNLAVSLSLHGTYGFKILALGIAVAALTNFTMLYVMFQKQVARLENLRLLAYLVRVCLAGGAMGAAVWATYRGLAQQLGTDGLGPRFAVAMIPIVVGVLAYAVACAVLRIEELSNYTARLRRR